jgi:hypothetical protein
MAQKTLNQETRQTNLGKHRKVTTVAQNNTTAESSVSSEYEEWLYNNPEALADVKRGLADSAAGRGVKMSFLEFADIETDD